MSSLLITIHVIAAIALIGPVMVSTSMFPARIAGAQDASHGGLGSLHTLATITKSYGMFSALVPILGIGVFLSDLDYYGKQGQFHASILLAIIAWALLLFVIVPRQQKVLEAIKGTATAFDFEKSRKQLAMFAGIFNLLWVICAVLMFL
ncbi:membrane protein [Corynebacterium phocae]|uniref:Membrane protein n=1 Tax=Corynebacterium phocae TaxID=161895 RepID=A0A1L7D3W3_9CORY|nr:DUF2269 domain-containing protein [Corynebacterium phocae]APT92795.1 membrane protein [Corynebacterium phocae]KAA8723109.1 DUF2269 domain-containing protein [Corynebacterium phocae]